jgi:hypothetical protein
MNLQDDEMKKPRGLTLHSKAPMINTFDIYNNKINLNDLLKTYNGVLIDFFRGTW